MNAEIVHKRYREHLNPWLAKLMNFAGFGVEVRAEGSRVWDSDGREFLDFLGGYGVFSIGHRHPQVVEAVKKQLDSMALSSKVLFNPLQAELASELARVSPAGLEYTFFSNSGAEAVEAAIKLARMATGRQQIIAFDGGYHGKTLGALSTTGREKYRKPFGELVPGTVFLPFDNIEALEREISEQTAAVLIEPIQGEGGIVVPKLGYLQQVRAVCDKFGALMIADEVQTGLGRTGHWFGVDVESVSPDIMPLAKALGGGVMPIGATLGKAEVFEKVFSDNPLIHTSTFGGNPLSCAAGIATLKVIQEEGLVERSRSSGEHLKNLLESGSNELIKEVRGRGLMIGAEFVEDEIGELVIAQMTKRGVLAAYTLNQPRVIRFEPPLNVSAEDIETVGHVWKESLVETQELLSALV